MSKFILNAFADEAGKTLDEQINALRENGYNGIEIRTIEEKNVTELTIDEAKEIKKRLDEAGLNVWSIGSPIGKIKIHEDFEQHMELYKHTLELSSVLEARAFRLFSFYMPKNEDVSQYEQKVIEQVGRFLDEAKQYDIMICHENEKGIYGDIAERCLTIHKALPGLGGIFDPANFLQCKQDTLEAWEMLHPYIQYMHIKDSNAEGQVVPAGEGLGNVATLLQKYRAVGGNVLTLEPHLKIFDGMKDLEKNFDEHQIGQCKVYPSSRAAFDAAVQALNGLIKEMQ